MDHLCPTSFPESLKATLNCYRITSIDSLSGPSGFPALAAQMWFKENKQLPPIPPQPMVQIPYFIPSDKSAKRSETVLAGEKIACFIVGGEKRLCLPQILTSVLREYSITEINQACGELHIYCSRCLPDQLEILKAIGILPLDTSQCGLITKTDAERLVALLTDHHDEPVKLDRLPKDIDPEGGFPVYHECFGRGYGKFYPKAYVSPAAQCIICEDCGHLFSPQRFITHSDRSFEKRVCHWGFDPENWRSYLLLPKYLEGVKQEEFKKILDQMKARFEKPRFDHTGSSSVRYEDSPPAANKRRYDSEQDSPNRKKIREDDGKIYEPSLLPSPYATLPYGVPSVLRHSAFRPWSPGLSTLAGQNPADTQAAIQDVAHLKGLLPFALNRRGFPQYIQPGRPLVLDAVKSEYSAPLASDAEPVRNVPPPLVSERKKSCHEPSTEEAKKPNLKPPARDAGTVEKNKSNNRHDRSPSLTKSERNRSRSFEHVPAERHRNHSVSLSTSNVAAVSPKVRAHQSPTSYPSTPQHRHSAVPNVSNNSNVLKETHEISRPLSRSREAAATAMLELKSAGLYRSAPVPPLLVRPLTPPTSCAVPTTETSHKVPPTSTTPKVPSVVPLDPQRQNYKWTIGGQSFVVSAAGVQSLEMLQSVLMNDCGNERGRLRLMHELVKIRSLFEEKLDIEMRVRRDLEIELEHLRSNKHASSTSEARKLIRQEVETFRQEHARKTEDLIRREDALRKLEERFRLGISRNDDEKSLTEKDVKDLRSYIQKLEMTNNDIRLSLVEERGRREDAELRLEEIQHSRGRTAFLMESPLSRMVRGAGCRATTEEEKVPPSPKTVSSPNGRKSSTQVPPLPASSVVQNLSHDRLNGTLTVTSTSNNIQRDQHYQIDVEVPKTVVVS